MDKNTALNIAADFADAVRSKYGDLRVILFGSFAKGNFHEESDIDIAVIFHDYSSRSEMQLELMKMRRKIDSRIEPHPFRIKEFQNHLPLVSEIVTHGQIL